METPLFPREEHGMELSPAQQVAYNQYLEGKNTFITGPGGTGKTALIRIIQQHAYHQGMDVQVCALTGCAAVLLDCKAKTVHSWAGIGLGNGAIPTIVEKIMKNHYIKATWKAIDLLIIDEVSMMSQKLFELLDTIGKTVRRKPHLPFGGIQLLFSGDFYQLPPVGNKDEPDTTRFCFESPRWLETFAVANHVNFAKIFRQSDPIYQRILNQLREGRLKRSSNEVLLNRVKEVFVPSAICPIRPTKLFPTRNKVEMINQAEMGQLEGHEVEFHIKYVNDLEMSPKESRLRMNFTKEQVLTEQMYLQGNLRCDPVIKLKLGAQVMCVVNISLSNGEILHNGAQGMVVSFDPKDGFPVVLYKNGFQMRMVPYTWTSEFIPGIGVAQVPLILAWALTIHKAQGATLDIAEVDAGSGIFECGQTYVALSRVKSLEGLFLCSFDAKRVKINAKAQEFYEMLELHETTTNKEKTNKETKIIPISVAVAVAAENHSFADDMEYVATEVIEVEAVPFS